MTIRQFLQLLLEHPSIIVYLCELRIIFQNNTIQHQF